MGYQPTPFAPVPLFHYPPGRFGPPRADEIQQAKLRLQWMSLDALLAHKAAMRGILELNLWCEEYDRRTLLRAVSPALSTVSPDTLLRAI